jgi:hypothetical protein
MKIACTSGRAATRTVLVFLNHSISRGMSRQEPFADDKTTWVKVDCHIDADEEQIIRREIALIVGATIHE